MLSCSRVGASKTTKAGYKAVRGSTIEALPPWRIAAIKLKKPRPLNTPLSRAQPKFFVEYSKTALPGNSNGCKSMNPAAAQIRAAEAEMWFMANF
jgi:hypothetical protein